MRLFELQNWRCVYCQSKILGDENGFRELDHILPKGRSPRCKNTKARSDDIENRRHTLGYPRFTFEPKNLVIACKECNVQKGSYDPLRHRGHKPGKYPKSAEMLWLYPHEDTYSEHIKLDLATWTYTKITDKGERVIVELKFDQEDILEQKYKLRMRALAAQASDFVDVVSTFAQEIKNQNASIVHAVPELVRRYKITQNIASSLLSVKIKSLETNVLNDVEAAHKAINVVFAQINAAAAVP